MNKYFRDARYYLGRTVEMATKGVAVEIEPVERRIRKMIGKEREQPGRRERVEREFRETRKKAENETKRAVGRARGRVERYRS